MAENESETSAPITPYLYYEDVAGALEWLARVFQFREREPETMKNTEGKVVHSAMTLGDGVIMMGCPGAEYQCPKRLGQATQNVYVYVQDVEQHFQQARDGGATILSDLEDAFYGDRRYGAADLEGHHWYFAQKLRELKPDEWNPTAEDLADHG